MNLRCSAIVIATALLWTGAAYADPKVPKASSRGQMLYENQCSACHGANAHWRDKKLVSDAQSLRTQVKRWATNAGQQWSDDDVEQVARYLNTRYYHLPGPA